MANGGWKIARNRGGAQLPLALLMAFAVALILIGKAQSNLFDRARADMSDMASPALNLVRTPLAGVNRWIGGIGHFFSVYEENIHLREEVARLRQWQNTAIVLDDRVKRYQMLLHAVPDPALSSVMARVLGRASHPFLQTMILDAGTDQGVKPGQAVIDARGMIGRIDLAGRHTSWVVLLTDLNSRIPVTLEPGNMQAIMAGDNTGVPTLGMLSQPNHTPKAGMQVVSSGDGGLLPPGLAIGTVVADGSGGFRVALLADSTSSEDVRIVDFGKRTEAAPSLSQRDLPAVAAGLPPAAPPPPMIAHTPAPVTIPPGAAPIPPPKVNGKPAAALVAPVKPAVAAAPSQTPADAAADAGTNE